MSGLARTSAIALLAAASLGAASARAATTASLEGVWTIASVVVTGANPVNVTTPQPNLYIFARGHYSNVVDNARTPRTSVTFADPAKPTDAEKLAKYEEWGPMAAQSGRPADRD